MISGLLLFPALLGGQPLPRRALSIFPADTEQFAYVNLLELRRLPESAQIHQRLLGRQLRDFEDFLRSLGINPEGDVDEVVLGWRGQKLEGGAFFGLVEGRFQPAAARAFFAQQGLPLREYAGQDLFAFGSGEAPQDLFFTFLSSSSAAFGRLNDLKAMLEVCARTRMALDSSETFVNWEAELEGSTPQWGIVAGKAVAVQGKALLVGGPMLPVKPNAVTKLVDAILYKIDWAASLTRVSVLARNREGADTLAGLLTIWQATQSANSSPVPRITDISTNGSRIELSLSGPLELIQSSKN